MATQKQINIVAAAAEGQGKLLLKHCVGIYLSNEEGVPGLHGSGFLLESGRSKYLVTAAHVLDEQEGADSSLYFPISNGEFFMVEGNAYKSPKVDGRRDLDKIDLAVIKLKQKCNEKLEDENFISVDQINLDFSSCDHAICIAMGYPATQNKRVNKKRNKVKRTPYSYTAETLRGEPFYRTKGDPYSNLLIKFKKKHSQNTQGTDVTAPDPHGMSGGPLWHFDPKGNPKLIGVLIEFHKNEGAMMSTRIAFVTEMINSIEGSSAKVFPSPLDIQLSVKLAPND